jgi:hypothetical protein
VKDKKKEMNKGPSVSGRPHVEMLEGAEAGERFTSALKTILTVSKSAVPNPFTKPKKRRKKR